jgi:hypothetical protein
MTGLPVHADITLEWCSTWVCRIDWLYDWQTLITGILAVSAAVYAAKISWSQLKASRDQIEVQREHDFRARAGRLRVARAALPQALSQICRYAEATIEPLKEVHATANNLVERTIKYGSLSPAEAATLFPTFPPDALAALTGVLEFVDDEAVGKMIESILREAQVFDSRNSTLLTDQGINGVYIEAIIAQALSLYARAESLFLYARNQNATVDAAPLWDRVFSVASRLRFTPEQWPILYSLNDEEISR